MILEKILKNKKFTYIFLVGFLLAIIFSGCECRNPFMPHTPQEPIGNLPPPHEPTTPIAVIENLWRYCATGDITNYMKCFTHPTDYRIQESDDPLVKKIKEHYQFKFIISEDWDPSVGIKIWDYDTEEKYNRNMFKSAQIEITLTDYENVVEYDGELEDKTPTNKKEAKVTNIVYEVIVTSPGKFHAEARGYVSFYLVKEGTSDKPEWKIYQWIDSKN